MAHPERHTSRTGWAWWPSGARAATVAARILGAGAIGLQLARSPSSKAFTQQRPTSLAAPAPATWLLYSASATSLERARGPARWQLSDAGPAQPVAAKKLVVVCTEADQRSAWLRWAPVDGACAYYICFGLAPEERYSCIMVHSANDYTFKGMGKDRPYYFTSEARNENGVSARLPVVLAK